jgi:hypothetical protein
VLSPALLKHQQMGRAICQNVQESEHIAIVFIFYLQLLVELPNSADKNHSAAHIYILPLHVCSL